MKSINRRTISEIENELFLEQAKESAKILAKAMREGKLVNSEIVQGKALLDVGKNFTAPLIEALEAHPSDEDSLRRTYSPEYLEPIIRLEAISQGKHLPPSWTTLYELTKLDDDTFDQKLRDGSINPEMQRKEVARANRILNRERDRQRVENLPPIRASAKTGKQVSAISALSACDPDQAPALDPRRPHLSGVATEHRNRRPAACG
jgi:hypothetical protein